MNQVVILKQMNPFVIHTDVKSQLEIQCVSADSFVEGLMCGDPQVRSIGDIPEF